MRRSFVLLAALTACGSAFVTGCSAPAPDGSSSTTRALLTPCDPTTTTPGTPDAGNVAVAVPFALDVGSKATYALARSADDAFVLVTLGDDGAVSGVVFSFASYAAVTGTHLKPTSITMGSDYDGNERALMIVDDGAHGAIFSVGIDGSDPKILHTFTGGADGGKPVAKLATIGGTEILGITAENNGSIFRLFGADGVPFRTLHTFTGGVSDGASPAFGLTIRGGEVWGVTERGGANDSGTLFSLMDDGWGYEVIHSFDADEKPLSGVVDARGFGNNQGGLRGVVYDARPEGGGSTLYGIEWFGANYTRLHSLPFPAAGGRFSTAFQVASPNLHPVLLACGPEGLFRMTADGTALRSVFDEDYGVTRACDDLVSTGNDSAIGLLHDPSDATAASRLFKVDESH